MLEIKKDTTAKIKEKQLVIFHLSGEEFGVDVFQIKEIIRLQNITPMPKAPDFIEGIINLRGQIITIISLEKRFFLIETVKTTKSRIVIADIKNNTVGLIVDQVPEVLRIKEDDIISTPEIIETQIHSDFIKGVCKYKNRLIIILDLEKILNFDEIKQINKVAEEKI